MTDSVPPQLETQDKTQNSSAAAPPLDLLERYGLLDAQLQEDRGQKAADCLDLILHSIENEQLPLETRLSLSRALLSWHDSALRSVKAAALRHSFLKIIQVSRYILVDPDGANLSLTAQRVAKDLALLLSRQIVEDAKFMQFIYRDLLKALQYVVDQKIVLAESADGLEAPSLRCDSLRLFMQCLPDEVDNEGEVKAVVALLMQVSSMAAQAPLLRGFIAHKISTLRIDDDDILTPYMSSMMDLIKSGHGEVFGKLRRRVVQLGDYLDDLLDNISFDQLQDALEELAHLDPRKLAKHLNALVSTLAREVWEHKLIILGILLTVAAVSGAVFLPCLFPIGMACLTEPRLYIALFKLLVEVGSQNESLAMTCLQVISKILRSGLVTSATLQSALIDAINVIKDACKYCNLFHPDTLSALATCQAANPTVYQNILTWNQGRSARIGDKARYLTSAGEVSSSSSQATSSGTAGGSAAGSADRSSRSSSSRLRFWGRKKTPLVSPSPQSHTLQVAHQAVSTGQEDSQAQTVQTPSIAPGSELLPSPSSGDLGRLAQSVPTPSVSIRDKGKGGGETLAQFAARHQLSTTAASSGATVLPPAAKSVDQILSPLEKQHRPLQIVPLPSSGGGGEERSTSSSSRPREAKEQGNGEEEHEDALRPVGPVSSLQESSLEVAVSRPSLFHGMNWLRAPSKLKVGPDARQGQGGGQGVTASHPGPGSEASRERETSSLAVSPTSHSPMKDPTDADAEIRALRERIAQLEVLQST